jgi:DNA-binding MarR family transcriptional regulator
MDRQKIKLLREKLRILDRESGNVFENQEDCCGLTTAQCHTLLEVGERGPISLNDLASYLGLDTSTLSRTVQGLVLLGLVDRQSNEKDRRSIVLSLTKAGRKVYDTIEHRYNDYFGRVMDLLPPEQRSSILEGIGAFADAVRSHNAATGCCGRVRKS